MRIIYSEDQGHLYLSKIYYTNNVSDGLASDAIPNGKVAFHYEDRNDIVKYSNGEDLVSIEKRLKTIAVMSVGTYEEVRAYDLDYDDTTGFSILESVQQYGSDFTLDANGAVTDGSTLPAIELTSNNTSPSFAPCTNTSDSSDYEDYEALTADFNKDNIQDILYYDKSSNQLYIYFGNANGTFSAVYGSPDSIDYTGWELTTGDINGDGKTDLMYYRKATSGDHYAYMGNGDGTFQTRIRGPEGNDYTNFDMELRDFNHDGKADILYYNKTWQYFDQFYLKFWYIDFQPIVMIGNGNGTFGARVVGSVTRFVTSHREYEQYYYTIDVTDLNNDGTPDFLIAHPSSNTHRSFFGNSDGSFSAQVTWQDSISCLTSVHVTGDFNGDGIMDSMWIHPESNNHCIYFGYGDGTYAPSFVWYGSTNYTGWKLTLSDFNGDGLTDIMYYRPSDNSNHVYLSRGDGTSLPVINYSSVTKDYTNYEFTVGDFTGDGKTDFMYYKLGDQEHDLYEAIPDEPLYKLTGIENGMGATTTLEYTPSSAYENTNLPFIVHTISSMTVDDGLGTTSTSTYTYSGGLFDFPEREFRGFEYVKSTSPNNTTSETWFYQSDYLKGRSHRTESRDPSETLLGKTEQTWQTTLLNTGYENCAFVKQSQVRNENYDSAGTVFSQEDATYDDTNGNLLTRVVSGTGAESITTEYEYTNMGTWLWRATKATTTGSTSGKVRETTYAYQSATGNLLSQTSWNNSGASPTVSMSYDSFGNLVSTTDAKGNPPTTTTIETTANTYPGTVTYPTTSGVTHAVVNESYDYRFGQVTQARDENGNLTCYSYDKFGRLEETNAPDGGQVTIQYYDTASPRYSVAHVKENATSTIDEYAYVDGLGRTRQTLTIGEGSNKIVTRAYYDNMGRNYRTEGPYFSTAIQYGASPSEADYPWQETTFDYRGRPTAVESPNSDYGTVTAQFAYNGLVTTATDPDGSQIETLKDYLGRTKQITEYINSTPQNTYYTYNAAGDLLTVTDHLGNANSISYNSLGQKTAMTDPDMGSYSYTYDPNGNLLTQTDAKSQIITYTYDALNRVLTKSYSTSDPTVTYTYDNLSITNGRGRLYSVNNTNSCTTVLAYDTMGRVTNSRRTITGDATNYDTQNTYDLAGKTTQITYPDGYQVSYSYYPGTGLLQTVQGVSDSRVYAYYSNYKPSGAVGQVSHVNGTTDYRYYDPFTMRITSIRTTSVLGDLQYWSYGYTPAGDIEEIHNIVTDVTYDYTYDELHRLLSETSDGAYPAINYTYNAIGNIMSKTYGANSYAYTYDTTRKHAVANINFNGNDYAYTYDGNGNMTAGPDFTDPTQTATRAISYNADNLPTNIVWTKAATVTSAFTYDGSGTRVKKTIQGGSTTWYIGSHYEKKDSTYTKYIFAGGTRIAKVTTSGYHILHSDHLGSSTVISDSSGAIAESTEYNPFGTTRSHSGATLTNYKYTDQELDPETGLYNYGARYYDPMIGRFISPDPIVQAPFNPQSLNRYSYCINSPLMYVDPSGYFLSGLRSFCGDLWHGACDFVGDLFGNIWNFCQNPVVAIGIQSIAPVPGTFLLLQSHTGRDIIAGEILIATIIVTWEFGGPVASGALIGETAGGVSAYRSDGDLLKGVVVGGTVGGATGYLGGQVAFYLQDTPTLANITQGAARGFEAGVAAGYGGGQGDINTMFSGGLSSAVTGGIIGGLTPYGSALWSYLFPGESLISEDIWDLLKSSGSGLASGFTGSPVERDGNGPTNTPVVNAMTIAGANNYNFAYPYGNFGQATTVFDYLTSAGQDVSSIIKALTVCKTR